MWLGARPSSPWSLGQKKHKSQGKFEVLNFIKITHSDLWKIFFKEMKRQAEEYWKKIFAKHIADKGLTSWIYKEVSRLNNKKDLSRHITKDV